MHVKVMVQFPWVWALTLYVHLCYVDLDVPKDFHQLYIGTRQTWLGANSLRCTKILSQCHPFLSFLPCKDTFMDDYDGI
jgi:hypothetical protein